MIVRKKQFISRLSASEIFQVLDSLGKTGHSGIPYRVRVNATVFTMERDVEYDYLMNIQVKGIVQNDCYGTDHTVINVEYLVEDMYRYLLILVSGAAVGLFVLSRIVGFSIFGTDGTDMSFVVLAVPVIAYLLFLSGYRQRADDMEQVLTRMLEVEPM